jgi:hypothetical protein
MKVATTTAGELAKPTSAGRRQVLRIGAAAALLATGGALRLHAAESAQASAFDAIDLDWRDARRQRDVPVRLYLPRAADAGRGHALVVFSHGIGGSRRGYSWLGQHFARQGIASLHLQHVGSDRTLWAGSVWGVIGRLHDAAQEAEAVHRAHDLRFALDTLLAGELGGRFDAARIVAAGHSYGANTTLLASGARVWRDGRLVELRDERVRAAIVISAPPFYGEADARAVLGAVHVPSLHVTCTDDVIRIPGYYSGADDRVAVFDATGSARKWLAVYAGGSHSLFTDRVVGGIALQVKAATQELASGFLRSVFDADDSALAAWQRRHTALLAQFTSGGAAAGAART